MTNQEAEWSLLSLHARPGVTAGILDLEVMRDEDVIEEAVVLRPSAPVWRSVPEQGGLAALLRRRGFR
jgi:hypothetical protein